MYKRSNQGWLKHIDFILWDILVLQLSFVFAYMLRHGMGMLPYRVPTYQSLSIILIVVDFLVAVIFNTLHNVMKRGYYIEFTQTLRHVALVLAIMSVYLFSTQSGDIYSRITIYLTAAFHLAAGYLVRILLKITVRRINRNKPKATMILVAEEGRIPEILKKAGELDGFSFAGLVLSNRDATGEIISGIPVVAGLKDAADYICREWVDEVFIYPSQLSDVGASVDEKMENLQGEEKETVNVAGLIDQCRLMAIPIHIRLPLSDVGEKTFIEKVAGYDVLTLSANYASPLQLAIKRLMDILGGLIGSIAALIVIAVIGPKIRKESPGPVLFRQTRIGLNGKKFTFYKIRSMYMDAEERKKELMSQNRIADGMMFKMDFDPRIIGNKIVDGKQVTGIGEMIRSTSLDEFPQFFNVLIGDMSLVGTRPPTLDEWEKYKYHHRARLATKPGLTGMWQISGRSKITDFEEVVKLDTEYINNWSLELDMKILIRTFAAVFHKDGAM